MKVLAIVSEDFQPTKRTLSAWEGGRQDRINLSIDNTRGNALGIVRLDRDQAQELIAYLTQWIAASDPRK